jgi:hypothetical protein
MGCEIYFASVVDREDPVGSMVTAHHRLRDETAPDVVAQEHVAGADPLLQCRRRMGDVPRVLRRRIMIGKLAASHAKDRQAVRDGKATPRLLAGHVTEMLAQRRVVGHREIRRVDQPHAPTVPRQLLVQGMIGGESGAQMLTCLANRRRRLPRDVLHDRQRQALTRLAPGRFAERASRDPHDLFARDVSFGDLPEHQVQRRGRIQRRSRLPVMTVTLTRFMDRAGGED